MNIRTDILIPDAAEIAESLQGQSCYSFSGDLSARMRSAGLSSSQLGARCLVSHTIVDKWRLGKARPNGKERFKELGMALGMDAPDLSRFLYLNGYPRLHAKNPLDNAATYLLNTYAGHEDTVSVYRALNERLGLSACTPLGQKDAPATAVMSADFKAAAAAGHLSTWFQKNRVHFTDDAKTRLPGERLCGLIELYLPEGSLNELGETGVLPITLRNLLYPVLAGRAVTVRSLREKLIALGLLLNMTAEETDMLLECEKLRPLTEPASALDAALLAATVRAHERYPLYERENLSRALHRLKNADPPFGAETEDAFAARAKEAVSLADYYEAHRGEEETLFEENYSSYSDKGAADYVRDVLTLLTENGTLDKKETEDLLILITDINKEDGSWN